MFNYLLFSLFCLASTLATAEIDAHSTTDTDAIIAAYRAEDNFATVKENVTNAIINHGLTVSNTLHISEMLNRTGQDLGFPNAVYTTAESIEFCSALISHKMTQLSPLNLTICPLTIAIYNPATEPKQTYVAFRKPHLVGKNHEQVEQEIETLLETIVEEALDF